MQTIEMDCRRSRILTGGLIAGAGLAFAAVWLGALPQVVQVVVSCGLLVALVRAIREVDRPLALRLLREGSIQVWHASDWRDAGVDAASFVSPFLIVLRLTCGTQRFTRILLPDSANAECLRRLRVSLRWASRTHLDTVDPDAG